MFRPPFLWTSSEVFKHLYQIFFILSKKRVNSQCPSSLSGVKVKTERSLKDQLLKVHYIIYLRGMAQVRSSHFLARDQLAVYVLLECCLCPVVLAVCQCNIWRCTRTAFNVSHNTACIPEDGH
jgi:hypothetical protein